MNIICVVEHDLETSDDLSPPQFVDIDKLPIDHTTRQKIELTLEYNKCSYKDRPCTIEGKFKDHNLVNSDESPHCTEDPKIISACVPLPCMVNATVTLFVD